MRVLVAATYEPFADAPRVRLANELQGQLAQRGFRADTLLLPFAPESSKVTEQLLAFRLLDLSESSGDKIDRLVTIDTPACAFKHSHKNAWLLDDLWNANGGEKGGPEAKPAIEELFLRECRNLFADSQADAKRLQSQLKVKRTPVLYPPMPSDHPYQPGPLGNEVVLATTLTSIQQTELVLSSISFALSTVKLVLPLKSIQGIELAYLKRRVQEMRLEERVRLANVASDAEYAQLVSGSCGSVCLALGGDADLQAVFPVLYSGKPVIVVSDEARPCELVRDGHNGFVAAAKPREIAEGLDRLFLDKDRTAAMGAASLALLKELRVDWEHIIGSILA